MSDLSNVKYPTDFELKEITLFCSFGPISLKQQLVELNLFEDLFAGTLSGQIVLSDSVGIINGASLNGTEYIKITLDKTISEGIEIERVFRVFSITNRSFSINNTFETYTINICSDEFLLSEQYRICKSYKKQTISNIIKDILNNFLGVGLPNTKPASVEDTVFTYDFILPNKKIFETINWLSLYASPAKNGYSGTGNNLNGADMIFFENNDGLYFASLATLFTQPALATYNFAPKNVTSDLNQEYYNIMNLEILENFDTLKGIMNGTFANRLITFDPLLRKKYVTDYNYNTLAGNYQSLNGAPITNNYENRFNQTLYDAPGSSIKSKQFEAGVLRMAAGNYNQLNQSNYLKQAPETIANDINAENYIPNRVGQLALSQYQKIRITVPGNPELFVGMTLEVNVEAVSLTTAKNERSADNQLSGKYLVSAIRHIVNNTSYITVIELCKGSNLGAYAGATLSDPIWKSLVSGNQKITAT